MIKVGITGGIGSGKSTVCRIFEMYGIPIYNADDRAKKLMTSNKTLKNSIIELFSANAYFKNGRLNRKYIAEIAFNDKSKLEQLNKLVHPAVAQDGEKWFDSVQKKGHPYAIKEAALLIESGSHKFMDKLIVVTAPIETRISRVMKRDKAKRNEVESRLNKQMKEEDKLLFADFVIENNEIESLIYQVQKIHSALLIEQI